MSVVVVQRVEATAVTIRQAPFHHQVLIVPADRGASDGKEKDGGDKPQNGPAQARTS